MLLCLRQVVEGLFHFLFLLIFIFAEKPILHIFITIQWSNIAVIPIVELVPLCLYFYYHFCGFFWVNYPVLHMLCYFLYFRRIGFRGLVFFRYAFKHISFI